jgi:hypothetical protein
MDGALLDEGQLPQNFSRAGYGRMIFGGDDSLAVRFFYDVEKSGMTGTALFTNEAGQLIKGGRKLFCEIHCSAKQTVVREANDELKARFPRQYQAFLNNEDQRKASGTPLEVAPFLDAAWIEILNMNKIFSIEGLAALNEGQLQQLPAGGVELRRRAREFLEMTKNAEPVVKLQHENQELRKQMEELRQSIDGIKAQNYEARPAKRGRPANKQPKNMEQDNDVTE